MHIDDEYNAQKCEFDSHPNHSTFFCYFFFNYVYHPLNDKSICSQFNSFPMVYLATAKKPTLLKKMNYEDSSDKFHIPFRLSKIK